MTKASDNEYPSLLIKEGAAPSSPAAGDQRLFIDSADHLLKRKNSGGTVTAVGGGLADQGLATYLDFDGAAAPADPTGDHARIYAKTDGRIYSRDSGGVEYGPFDAGGGAAAPTLYYVAGATWATYSDKFEGPSLGGQWTAIGSPTLTFPTPDCGYPTVAAGNCLDLGALAGGTGITQAVPATPWKAVLGFSLKHASSSGNMFGLFASDGTTQRGIGLYNTDANLYAPLGAASYSYDNLHTIGWSNHSQGYGVVPWLGFLIYRIGSTDNHALTMEMSDDGGASWVTSGSSPYATGLTITSIFIGSILGTLNHPQLLFFNWE